MTRFRIVGSPKAGYAVVRESVGGKRNRITGMFNRRFKSLTVAKAFRHRMIEEHKVAVRLRQALALENADG